MLRFLHGARRALIDPQKARSYLLYATGEVVLVVVGILIALQVNNWSEERATDARLVAILHEIQSDLVEDLELAGDILPQGVRRDSILQRVRDDDITREEYADNANRALFWAALQYQPFTQNRTAYARLSGFDGIIPVRYSEVLDLLEDLYVWESGLLTHRQEIFIAQIEGRHEYLTRTYPWYWRLERGQPPDDAMLDYYLYDPEYKNFAYRFRAVQTVARDGEIESYRLKAAGVYAAISGFLGETVTAEAVPKGLLLDDPQALIPYLGEYGMGDDCCVGLDVRSGVLYLGRFPIRHREGTTFEEPYRSEQWMEIRADDDGAHVMTVWDGDESTVLTRRPETR